MLAASSDPAIAIARIVEALKAARANEIRQMGQSITFRAGLFRLVTSMNPLVAIDWGELTVLPTGSRVAIDYKISFRQIFMVASLGVLGFLGPFVLSAPNLNAWQATLLLASAWLWLFGGNVLIASVWFPRWLRRAGGT